MATQHRCKSCHNRNDERGRPRLYCDVFKFVVTPSNERKDCKHWVGAIQRRAPVNAARGSLGGGG